MTTTIIRTILFLQLFAEANVQTTLLDIPGNSLKPEMKTFYDMTLLDEAAPALVHQQFGQKRPIPANGGKTIEFRKFSSLPKALTALTEGVTPDGGVLDVTTVTATVAQYGYYITQSDLLELTAIDNTIVEATKLLGKQAGVTLDTVVRDILVAGTNVSYAPAVSDGVETEVTSRSMLDGTSVISVKSIQKLVAKLRANNAPTINGDYVAVIHPYVAYDLMRDPEWIDAHKYAQPEELYKGEIGKIAGVRFVQSSEAKIFRGEDLAADSRTLTVNGAVSSGNKITFDGGSVEVDALVGRKILVDGQRFTVNANTATTITVDASITAAIADNAVIYPGEGGKDGIAVFACLFLADGAYGVTEVTGGGMQTFVKQKGSAGTADPLDQRSTVGWKALLTAEILIPNYLVRFECASAFSANAAAN